MTVLKQSVWLGPLLGLCLLLGGCIALGPRRPEAGRKLFWRSQAKSTREDDRRSWLESWFAPAEPEPPQSIKEFMSLPRPGWEGDS